MITLIKRNPLTDKRGNGKERKDRIVREKGRLDWEATVGEDQEAGKPLFFRNPYQ